MKMMETTVSNNLEDETFMEEETLRFLYFSFCFNHF